MTTFSQLRPFTIGYDDIFDHFEQLMEYRVPNYPPYNIIKTGEYTHDVEVALAGYSKDDIEVEVKENTLTIKSIKPETSEDEKMAHEEKVIHKGIANLPESSVLLRM
jgi:molecular chaperone IbpA